MLAAFFEECGAVMDVRVCGDANQDLRFAFLEFAEERSVEQVPTLICASSQGCKRSRRLDFSYLQTTFSLSCIGCMLQKTHVPPAAST